MQKDMHYYGTYVLARAAGIHPNNARVIASAAQFVDDNNDCGELNFSDGGAFFSEQTANGLVDADNLNGQSQRKVWVPFHFLPGNRGESFAERLVCRKDSPIAQRMVNNHLSKYGWDCADELMGITAHVYADTFSHYGFSGVSCPENRIINNSIEFDRSINPITKEYIMKRSEGFMNRFGWTCDLKNNICSFIGEAGSGALGHGAVCTFPDRPFLRWRFKYENNGIDDGWRDNQDDFMLACQRLHAMFVGYRNSRTDIADRPPMDFSEIEGMVREILTFEGAEEDRSSQWINAVENGMVGFDEHIPPYMGEEWNSERDELQGSRSDYLLEKPVYRFYQAASYHRQYVLRELLPASGLLVA